MRRLLRIIRVDAEYFWVRCWVCNRRRFACKFQMQAYVNFYMGVI